MENKLAQAQQQLSQWQSPADFIALVDEWPSWVVVQPRNGFLREAWVLAEFIKLMEVDRVRLADRDERWPDGYIEVGGALNAIEITEALELDRRRGDELKVEDPQIELDPVEAWVARAEQIPTSLRASIERKANKQYGGRAILLVYLNIDEWGIRQQETTKAIAAVKADYDGTFEQIVVLWKYKLY